MHQTLPLWNDTATRYRFYCMLDLFIHLQPVRAKPAVSCVSCLRSEAGPTNSHQLGGSVHPNTPAAAADLVYLQTTQRSVCQRVPWYVSDKNVFPFVFISL